MSIRSAVGLHNATDVAVEMSAPHPRNATIAAHSTHLVPPTATKPLPLLLTSQGAEAAIWSVKLRPVGIHNVRLGGGEPLFPPTAPLSPGLSALHRALACRCTRRRCCHRRSSRVTWPSPPSTTPSSSVLPSMRGQAHGPRASSSGTARWPLDGLSSAPLLSASRSHRACPIGHDQRTAPSPQLSVPCRARSCRYETVERGLSGTSTSAPSAQGGNGKAREPTRERSARHGRDDPNSGGQQQTSLEIVRRFKLPATEALLHQWSCTVPIMGGSSRGTRKPHQTLPFHSAASTAPLTQRPVPRADACRHALPHLAFLLLVFEAQRAERRLSHRQQGGAR